MDQEKPAPQARAASPRWRRLAWWALGAIAAAALACALRGPLLRAMGNWLITEDPVTRVDEVFVLGGAIVDRGQEAARVHAAGLSGRFIFTGAPVPTALLGLGIDSTEAQCTRNEAVRCGLPLERTVVLNAGTSTFEEARALLAQARADGADTVMVVSSKFHLRRVGFVFRERFREAGITVLLHGAPATTFEETAWWRSEEGLIMVANEYIKLAYYHLKY